MFKNTELKKIFGASCAALLFAACASRGFTPNSEVSADKRIKTAKENMQKLTLGTLDSDEEEIIRQRFEQIDRGSYPNKPDPELFPACSASLAQIGVPDDKREKVYQRLEVLAYGIHGYAIMKGQSESKIKTIEEDISKIDGFTGQINDAEREILVGLLGLSDVKESIKRLKGLSCGLGELQKAKEAELCKARSIQDRIDTNLTYQYRAVAEFADPSRYEIPDFRELRAERVQARRFATQLAKTLGAHAKLLRNKRYSDRFKHLSDTFVLNQFEFSVKHLEELADSLQVAFKFEEAVKTLRDDSRRWRGDLGEKLTAEAYAAEVLARKELLKRLRNNAFSRGNVRESAKENIVSLEEVISQCTDPDLKQTAK